MPRPPPSRRSSTTMTTVGNGRGLTRDEVGGGRRPWARGRDPPGCGAGAVGAPSGRGVEEESGEQVIQVLVAGVTDMVPIRWWANQQTPEAKALAWAPLRMAPIGRTNWTANRRMPLKISAEGRWPTCGRNQDEADEVADGQAFRDKRGLNGRRHA